MFLKQFYRYIPWYYLVCSPTFYIMDGITWLWISLSQSLEAFWRLLSHLSELFTPKLSINCNDSNPFQGMNPDSLPWAETVNTISQYFIWNVLLCYAFTHTKKSVIWERQYVNEVRKKSKPYCKLYNQNSRLKKN